MGYMTDGLTFNTLRGGNTARLPEFRNNKGEFSHADPNDEWSLNDWITACLGELGEAANVLKKVRRGDLTLEEARPLLAQEFADTNIYLDILSMKAGINLGDAIIQTFNTKSEKVGSRIRIDATDWHRIP